MHWAKGTPGIAPPEWALIVAVAQECGVAPWAFEAECTEVWWHRLMVYRSAIAKAGEHG